MNLGTKRRVSIAVVTMFASAGPMTHYPEGVAYRLREGKPVRPRYQAPTPRTTTETARRAVSITDYLRWPTDTLTMAKCVVLTHSRK